MAAAGPGAALGGGGGGGSGSPGLRSPSAWRAGRLKRRGTSRGLIPGTWGAVTCRGGHGRGCVFGTGETCAGIRGGRGKSGVREAGEVEFGTV